MSRKAYIKKAITKFIDKNSILYVDYEHWYVGITGDPDRREREHGTRNVWRAWKADSVKDSRVLEKHFLDLGMNGNTGGGINAQYIYVYKLAGPYS